MNEAKLVRFNKSLQVTQSMQVIALPKPGIGLNEAKDRWLGAGSENRILDYGDKREPNLVVASEKSRQVLYELVPEMSPPGFTVEQMIRHLKAAGFDVRGEGPKSKDGNPTVVVIEKEH